MPDRSDDKPNAFTETDASHRRHRRWFVDFDTTIGVAGEALKCSVYDLSPGGACIRVLVRTRLTTGDDVDFEMPGYGVIPAEVRYSGDDYLGLRFRHDAEGELALGRYLAEIELSRRPKRHEMKLSTVLRASGVELPCVLQEASRINALVRVEDTRHLAPHQEVALALPDLGSVPALVTRLDESEVGLVFLQGLDLDPNAPTEAPGSDTTTTG